jgi:hypothetical protein
MRDNRSSNNGNSPVGSLLSNAAAKTLATEDDDTRLLSLEVQFNGLITELIAAQKASDETAIYPNKQSLVQDSMPTGVDAESDSARTRLIEAILARLYPIERAIMQTPACTIAGLGVKARHAAYVMSQYWEAPVDQIDWDAQVMRLLIEAAWRSSTEAERSREVFVYRWFGTQHTAECDCGDRI